MDIQIPDEHRSIIEDLVASGRFASPQEAIAAGIRLLASSEKLRSKIKVGVDQADREDVCDHDTVFAHLRALAMEAQAK